MIIGKGAIVKARYERLLLEDMWADETARSRMIEVGIVWFQWEGVYEVMNALGIQQQITGTITIYTSKNLLDEFSGSTTVDNLNDLHLPSFAGWIQQVWRIIG